MRALLRVATPENEVLLLDHARLMTASQLEKLSHKYALVQRHGQDPHPLGDAQRRCVRRRDTEDGMVKIEAVLHPEEAELVWTMLNHAATQLTREPAPPTIDDSAESGVAARAPRVAVTPPLSDAPDGRSDDSAESLSGTEPTSRRGQSVLHQRADAAKHAFNRADALVSLAQGYLSGMERRSTTARSSDILRPSMVSGDGHTKAEPDAPSRGEDPRRQPLASRSPRETN